MDTNTIVVGLCVLVVLNSIITLAIWISNDKKLSDTKKDLLGRIDNVTNFVTETVTNKTDEELQRNKTICLRLTEIQTVINNHDQSVSDAIEICREIANSIKTKPAKIKKTITKKQGLTL